MPSLGLRWDIRSPGCLWTPSANGLAEVIARGIAGHLIEEAAVSPGEDVGAPGISATTDRIVKPRPHDEVGPSIPIHVPSPGNGVAEGIARGIAGPLVEEAAVGPGKDEGTPSISPTTGWIVS